MDTYTINPHAVPRWKLKNTTRRRSLQDPEAAWTGTPEQLAVTTTDPVQFVTFPERFVWFHDRLRGEVFIRDGRSPAERMAAGEDPTKPAPILPHRYMRAIPQQDLEAGQGSLLRRLAAVKGKLGRYRPGRRKGRT